MFARLEGHRLLGLELDAATAPAEDVDIVRYMPSGRGREFRIEGGQLQLKHTSKEEWGTVGVLATRESDGAVTFSACSTDTLFAPLWESCARRFRNPHRVVLR